MKRTRITEDVLVKRINRKLEPELEKIRKTRARIGEDAWYWLQDMNTNTMLAQHLHLEAWGRQLGVLMAWEEVVQ
jgi:hypothetical protein